MHPLHPLQLRLLRLSLGLRSLRRNLRLLRHQNLHQMSGDRLHQLLIDQHQQVRDLQQHCGVLQQCHHRQVLHPLRGRHLRQRH